jgi:hypothetical protein
MARAGAPAAASAEQNVEYVHSTTMHARTKASRRSSRFLSHRRPMVASSQSPSSAGLIMTSSAPRDRPKFLRSDPISHHGLFPRVRCAARGCGRRRLAPAFGNVTATVIALPASRRRRGASHPGFRCESRRFRRSSPYARAIVSNAISPSRWLGERGTVLALALTAATPFLLHGGSRDDKRSVYFARGDRPLPPRLR